MEKVQTEKKKLHWKYVVLAVVITLSLTQIIIYFAFFKQGYHSDEIWSYGYANSFYQKDIHIDEDGNLTHMNEWTDTQVLKDYIEVNKGERFRYDSIYHNQILDLSPPLHSMVLHTICSFFPDKFSRWYSFSINIVSFVIAMIFLFKSATLLKNENFALCCCALYGFSMGARDTYIYLRMYAMGTAMTMILLYNVIRYLQRYDKEKKIMNRNLAAIWIVSLLSFLTHYHLVAFMGIMTALICLHLLCKKQIKVMFAFGFSMLAVFGLSVVVFPSMLQKTSGNIADVHQYINYNFEIRFRILANFISTKLFSIHIDIIKSGWTPIIIACLLFVFIISLPLMFFLRETKGMRKVIGTLRMFKRHPVKMLRYIARRIQWMYVIIFITVVCQMIVVGETTKVYGMGSIEDRYIFNLYPLVVLCSLGFLLWVVNIFCKKVRIKRVILGVGLLSLVGINIFNSTQYGDYLFRRIGDVDIEDAITGTDCIYIRNLPWMLTAMTPTLMNADEFAQIQYDDYSNIAELYREICKNHKITVIIDTSFIYSNVETMSNSNLSGDIENSPEMIAKKQQYKKIIKFLENLEPETEMKELTEQMIFSRKMEVYLINP